MSIKLRIKRGSSELEYEGPEEFLISNFPKVLENFSELSTENFAPAEGNNATENGTDLGTEASSNSGSSSGVMNLQIGTDSIAYKLGVKSGPDLVIAACAHLTFSSNRKSFTRKEILEDMKSADSHYKDSYSKNLTNSLSSLQKDGKLNKLSDNKYALPASQREYLETALA